MLGFKRVRRDVIEHARESGGKQAPGLHPSVLAHVAGRDNLFEPVTAEARPVTAETAIDFIRCAEVAWFALWHRAG